MTLVVLIADGGTDAGLGHLSRSSALALALQGEGALIRTLGLGLETPIERYGISWQPTADPDPTGADVIIIDSYSAADELRARMASVAPVVAFADDDRDFPESALVIRSGLATSREDELAGLAYACLGPEFWSGPSRSLASDVRRVLVTTGGGDHTDLGPALANRLTRTLPRANVALVCGPYSRPGDTFEKVQIISAPDSLFNPLVQADLVVSAAGQTMLEALALGTPCVALITAENQRRQASELQATGAITVAESTEQAVAASFRLAIDFEGRCRQARVGLSNVDGQGATRVAAAILELVRSRRAV